MNTQHDQDKFPSAMSPDWPCAQPNEPITLYSGPIDIRQHGRILTADGRIELHWLPTPGFCFGMGSVPDNDFLDAGPAELTFGSGTRISDAFVSRVTSIFGIGSEPSEASGWFNDQVIQGCGQAKYATFLMPNLDAEHGTVLKYSDRSFRCARLELHAAPWIITLDEATDRKSLFADLRSRSGYAVTSVGRLERVDGNGFAPTEAIEVLTALGVYSSFACGRWTGPCLPVGYDAAGQKAWQVWWGHRTESYRTRHTWLDTNDPNCSCYTGPFAGFYARWQDKFWRDVLWYAVHWFVEACGCAGSLEGSIVLTQTAFELLASAVLVESEGWLTTDGYEKLAAAERTRLLLKWAGIPTAIPSDLTALTAAAKAYNWPDSPAAMTEVRNTIAHPTKKNRDKYTKHSADARQDAWTLGLWSLELCLLRLFGYGGRYGNRLRQRWSGQTEPVPWSTKHCD